MAVLADNLDEGLEDTEIDPRHLLADRLQVFGCAGGQRVDTHTYDTSERKAYWPREPDAERVYPISNRRDMPSVPVSDNNHNNNKKAK